MSRSNRLLVLLRLCATAVVCWLVIVVAGIAIALQIVYSDYTGWGVATRLYDLTRLVDPRLPELTNVGLGGLSFLFQGSPPSFWNVAAHFPKVPVSWILLASLCLAFPASLLAIRSGVICERAVSQHTRAEDSNQGLRRVERWFCLLLLVLVSSTVVLTPYREGEILIVPVALLLACVLWPALEASPKLSLKRHWPVLVLGSYLLIHFLCWPWAQLAVTACVVTPCAQRTSLYVLGGASVFALAGAGLLLRARSWPQVSWLILLLLAGAAIDLRLGRLPFFALLVLAAYYVGMRFGASLPLRKAFLVAWTAPVAAIVSWLYQFPWDHIGRLSLREVMLVRAGYSGVLQHPTNVALTMEIMLPLAVAAALGATIPRERRFLWAVVPASGLALVLTMCRGGWMGAAAALGAGGLLLGISRRSRRTRWGAVVLVALLVPGIMWTNNVRHGIEGRVEYVRMGWTVFRAHPLFGAGAGAVHQACLDRIMAAQCNFFGPNSKAASHAHNQYLNLLDEHGVIGTALIAVVGWFLLRRLLRLRTTLRPEDGFVLTGLLFALSQHGGGAMAVGRVSGAGGGCDGAAVWGRRRRSGRPEGGAGAQERAPVKAVVEARLPALWRAVVVGLAGAVLISTAAAAASPKDHDLAVAQQAVCPT